MQPSLVTQYLGKTELSSFIYNWHRAWRMIAWYSHWLGTVYRTKVLLIMLMLSSLTTLLNYPLPGWGLSAGIVLWLRVRLERTVCALHKEEMPCFRTALWPELYLQAEKKTLSRLHSCLLGCATDDACAPHSLARLGDSRRESDACHFPLLLVISPAETQFSLKLALGQTQLEEHHTVLSSCPFPSPLCFNFGEV